MRVFSKPVVLAASLSLMGPSFAQAGFILAPDTELITLAQAIESEDDTDAELLIEEEAAEQAEAETLTEEEAAEQAEAEALAEEEAIEQAEADALAEEEAIKQAEADALAEEEAIEQAEANALAEEEAIEQAEADALVEEEAIEQAEADALAEEEAIKQAEADALAEEEALAEQEAIEQAEADALAEQEAIEQAEADALAEEEALAEQEAIEQAEADALAEQEAIEQAEAEALAEQEAIEQAEAEALAEQEAIEQAEAEARDDQQAMEQAEADALAAAADLDDQEAATTSEEVVTSESTRSSDQEVSVAAASDADSDSGSSSQVWKYLGAAAAGAVVGALIPQLGGRVVDDQGDRMIVERDGELHVRKDENLLLRRPGVTETTESFADGVTRSTVTREDGSRIVTIRDSGGFVLQRTRYLPDGTAIVLIDETRKTDSWVSSAQLDQSLPPLRHSLPDDRYVVDYRRADQDILRQALLAPPVEEFEQVFSLRQVRENHRIRAMMPRVDLDVIQFATGSSAIQPREAEGLRMIGLTMADIIKEHPSELFLVEGHTDAVGADLMNLGLSDRRAEAVALALTEYFDIPPENLVVQGYGERYLKVDTQGPSQENRRASVRRITPLIDAGLVRL
ncbi:OmpA family protein [Halomonas sp. ML-15]|uniref:OmpA family protein n=1 Tax=Halomonas sp. ML-15 TaxID=2773305 RepID=UPI001746D91D|nr:OmpA family protein [Halomonas sp. ML-15]MBD3895438.1 OmpA family protein [Halomonas sp. ML-15]